MKLSFRFWVPCLLLPYLLGGDWSISEFQANITKTSVFDVGGTGIPDMAYSLRLQANEAFNSTVYASHGGTIPVNGSAWSEDFNPSVDIGSTPHEWPTGGKSYNLVSGGEVVAFESVQIE